MEKQTIYILLAMAAFCVIFFLYLLSNDRQIENLKSKDEFNSENLDFSFKKKLDLIYDNYKQKYHNSKRLSLLREQSHGNPLVWMNAFPKYTEPNLNKNLNYTIYWRSTNTSIAEYSWIGIYPYAQKTDIFNCLTFFYLHKNLTGFDVLPIPTQAGYFDIRYIQDNNKKTLATLGPVLVNPKDSFIKVTNGEKKLRSENSENFENLNKDIEENLIDDPKENLVDLRRLNNFSEEENLEIEWDVRGKTLETLLNQIFDENTKKEEALKNAEESSGKPDADFNPKSKSGGNADLKPKDTNNDDFDNKNQQKFFKKGNNKRILEDIDKEKGNNKMKNPKQIFIQENYNYDYENNKTIFKEYDNLNGIGLSLKTQKLNVYICLTLLGSTESSECVWKKRLESVTNLSGIETLETPKIAGFYYFRIFLEKDGNFYESKDSNVVVSKIFKISSPNVILLPESLDSVVGSYLAVSWFSPKPQRGDWIGLYNLGDIEAFTESLSPIKSIRINNENAFYGNATVFLPTNKEAGQFVFVYFRNHKPISISDVMEVQQPRVSCPNKNFKNTNQDLLESLLYPNEEISCLNRNSTFNNFNYKNNTKKEISITERIKALKKLPQFTQSKIKHLVIICTENHSFDSYMGEYCEGETFSNPKCNYGPKCCEKPPKTIDGIKPFKLNDTQNIKWDPNHNQYCELCEINNGRMDGFVKGCSCSDPQNFAVADKETVKILHEYAKNYSMADRFFQPNAGASSQNDMYFARAAHVFIDNRKISMGSFGSNCWYTVHFLLGEYQVYYDPSITHLLSHCNFTLRTYAEGYEIAKKNFTGNPCYPNGFDSSDIPFNYYAGVLDKPNHIQDYLNYKMDIQNKTLPEVSFIKPLGNRTAHPGYGNITDELKFVKETADLVLNDEYYSENTLIIYVPDESGGYYDHISPPPTNEVDGVPYGPRIPFLAIGKFAKKNYISHVTMEHSSIIKFIEWNWLNGETGQLNVRDKNVNSIGDLIDPEQAGVIVP